jgi:hypothetical protein
MNNYCKLSNKPGPLWVLIHICHPRCIELYHQEEARHPPAAEEAAGRPQEGER